ncbi:hypothetical protein AAC387_Pa07g0628 [Persea americana]
MREPSMLVRDTVAGQLKRAVERLATVLVFSRDKDPSLPLRLWIVGYALQCLLHMVCVYVEYRCRHHQVQGELMEDGSRRSLSSQRDVEEDGVYDTEHT